MAKRDAVVSLKVKNQVEGTDQLDKANQKLKSLGAALEEAQKKFSRASFGYVAQQCAGVSLAFEGLSRSIGNLASSYNSFDKSMRAVNTMAGADPAGFRQMTDQVKELSKEIPIAREQLADGLYQVISNGVPKDNWMEFLEKSAKSAVGGMADLGGVVTVTSTIIKNYGLAWSDAQAIQDKIQTTAKNGVTSFEQLQQALPRVTGNAATLGVSIDELMASFATLTGVSGNTSEVSTQLAAIFTSLVKPSSEAAKMAGEMGIKFDAASIKAAGGFQNFLTQLDTAVKRYAAASGTLEQEVYGKLFGSAEALRALTPLTGELAAKYTENVAAMADSTGAIDQAFADMSGSGEAATTMLQNQMAAITDFAGRMASAVQPQMQFIALLGQSFAGLKLMGTGTMACVSALGALRNVQWATVLSTLKQKTVMLATAAAQKTVAAATWVWNTAQKALNFVLSANPIGVVVMALAALYKGLQYAYNHCEAFRNACDRAWAAVKPLAEAICSGLVSGIKSLCSWFKAAWDWVIKFFGISGKKIEVTAEVKTNIKGDTTPTPEGSIFTTPTPAKASKTSTSKAERKEPIYRDDAKTLEEMEENIDYLDAKIKKSTLEQAAALNILKKRWEDGANAIRTAGIEAEKAAAKADVQKAFDPQATKLGDVRNNIQILEQQLLDCDAVTAAAVLRQIEYWKKVEDSILNAGKATEKATAKLSDYRNAFGGLRGMKGGIESTTKAISGHGTAWERVTGIVDGAFAVYDGIKAVIGLLNLLRTATVAKTAADTAGAVASGVAATAETAKAATDEAAAIAAVPAIAANKALTASYMELAAAAFFAAHAFIPFAGFGIASGFVTASTSIVEAIGVMPFADGGLAYGPTLGLFGEYAGASSNPEVVAPLDKLQTLIEPTGGDIAFEPVELKIKDSQLYGLLRKKEQKLSRHA